MQDSRSAAYWDSFYDNKKSLSGLAAPSQFAAFMIQELPSECLILDVGCGSGRDSLFFATHGRKVVGIDRSQKAIDFCEGARSQLKIENARFLCRAVEDPDLHDTLGKLRSETKLPMAFYARFFLHAISEEDEDSFLDLIQDKAATGTMLGFEFRTIRDAALAKSTPEHYRRYVNPLALAGKLNARGFATSYYVEGFGFAKHLTDDAHVARIVGTRL